MPNSLLSRIILFTVLGVWVFTQAGAQSAFDPETIAGLARELRSDPRGPYEGIYWFCSDGTVRAARDPCPDDPRARQHADYKPVVKKLMSQEHLFFGPILTGQDNTAFWDAQNDHSRLKQYQLNDYLAAVDNGWVLQQARYYRGAFQVEDEQEWGRRFLHWLLDKNEVPRTHFYLIAQAARDIPHRGDTDLNRRIRARSKAIADDYPPFMDLRIKIHGKPGAEDAGAVSDFINGNAEELRQRELHDEALSLVRDIETAYGGGQFERLTAFIEELPKTDTLHPRIQRFLLNLEDADATARLTAAADLALALRYSLVNDRRSGRDRLLLFDVANELSDMVFRSTDNWVPATARQQMEKICYLGEAAAAAGLVELWEYETGGLALGDPNYQYIWPDMLTAYLDNARRYVEWGTATNRATYGEIVDRYADFEPKALGFLDDRIRGSVLLPLGEAVSKLADWLGEHSESGNALLDIPSQASARGLNPGYARGTLRIVAGTHEETEVNGSDIYVFGRPPADLKPVGGIMTVSEGNMVSHVQLLARNLGIPNAVISPQQFEELRSYDGQQIFYAVSPAGTVVMKPIDRMNETEVQLFASTERSQDRIRVPVDRIDLQERDVLDLRDINSSDSGVRCGPKAANLGQLKALFPDKVVEGLVIPFGVFRQHLDQQMPDQSVGTSYWQFLNDGFSEATAMEERGDPSAVVEDYTLSQLATLRSAIASIEVEPALVDQLRVGFTEVLGGRFGDVPVFLRSDTNMEDLADFTGAGLNKTVFNVVDRDEIVKGIRAVWASPYTERSYRWRQRYLLNPENVFPSILIIPSVDVDHSGVMITKGISSGRSDEVTVAFSRGAGGAVDGQTAESYLMTRQGDFILEAPARERLHRRLPPTGGSVMVGASFDEAILSRQNLVDLYRLAGEVERVMPRAPGVGSEGPFDVELGFKDDSIYLFQIRPFVENDRAQGSAYLQSLSPPARREGVYIDLASTLD